MHNKLTNCYCYSSLRCSSNSNLITPPASTTVELQAPTPTNLSIDPSNIASTSGPANEQEQQEDETQHDTDAVWDDNVFVSPFGTPSIESIESSSRSFDPSNMHTFYQTYPSEYKWMKDHPIEQVLGNTSKLVMTGRQLETDPEMCVYALTLSASEPKNIK
ncbi:hypothetical protein Tco_0287573 [Tanacetum coccineum]